jgi:hypothetical protein
MMDHGIERLFMAADQDGERSAQFGPFDSAADAERQARMLGWGWIGVYTNTIRNGQVIDTKTRFYQLPDEVDSLRRKIVRGKEAFPPMSDQDRKFFESYELQVQEGVNDVADIRSKAAGWTTNARMSAHLRRSS